jgi:hypothetical protein
MKRLAGRLKRPTVVVLMIALLHFGGCAGKQKVQTADPSGEASQVAVSEEHGGPTSHGHPFRLIAFVVHPVGVLIDYVVVRPIYWVASLAPGVFGYTSEDRAAIEKK